MKSLVSLARRRHILSLTLAFALSVILLSGLTALLSAQTTSPTTSHNSDPSVALQPNTPTAPMIELVPIAPTTTFTTPIGLAHAGDGRLFVVEQAGVIKSLDRPYDTMTATTFLDITDRVESGGEKGLLALAFHPSYAENGYFYVNYTHQESGQLYSRISRFQVTADPNVADPGSELILLQLAQPFENHNGGDLAFGDDGYLYASFGDGGSADDPQNNGQNPGTLLGTVLRLDVNGGGSAPDCGTGGNYTIPADNPLADGPGNNCDEIWAIGLRNPWRFSFDRQTYDLFIADVGQENWEEVNFQAADGGGENYGWRCYEGSHLYIDNGCDPNVVTYTMPIAEYNHDNGRCAITGGYIYRGSAYPGLAGYYLFADFCSGEIWSLIDDGGVWTQTLQLDTAYSIATFGQDVDGELYLADSSGGQIYRIQDTQQVTPSLSISVDGPGIAFNGEPFTYTLTIENSAAMTLTNLTITNSVPVSASYVSGGDSFDGQTVSWTLPELSPSGTVQVQWTAVVSSTDRFTIVNDDYGVTADGDVAVMGQDTAVTIVNPLRYWFPIMMKESGPAPES